jgi:transposase
MARKSKKQRLTVVHPHCAGIDIGSREHWVAVDPECCDEPVRRFTTFSDDLYELADWLQSLQVDMVAMEATGVYWIPLYEVLEARGFQVHLVNSRSTRQVSGRKSDVLDCQWIWQLMSYGLLKGAFRPADAVCTLRSLVRQQDSKVQEQSRCIQHMQRLSGYLRCNYDQRHNILCFPCHSSTIYRECNARSQRAHAKGLDADERAIRQRGQRFDG